MERTMHNFKPHDYATMDDGTFAIAVILEVNLLTVFKFAHATLARHVDNVVVAAASDLIYLHRLISPLRGDHQWCADRKRHGPALCVLPQPLEHYKLDRHPSTVSPGTTCPWPYHILSKHSRVESSRYCSSSVLLFSQYFSSLHMAFDE